VESVTVDGVSEEVPPVIDGPVIGMGAVIRVDEETTASWGEDPGAEIVVIANCGLVLPESPITTRTF